MISAPPWLALDYTSKSKSFTDGMTDSPIFAWPPAHISISYATLSMSS